MKKIQIDMIYNTEDKPVMYAYPGENIKIPVKIKETDVHRGAIVTPIKQALTCFVCYEFEARITTLSLLEENPVLCAGSEGLILHIHTAKEEVEIKKIRGVNDKETGELNKKIKVIGSHQTGIVVFKTSKKLCCEKFNVHKKLGYFTIRD